MSSAHTTTLSLELKQGLITPGPEAISGVVRLNLPLVRASGISEVVVKFIGEVKTNVFVSQFGVDMNQLGTLDKPLIDLSHSLWSAQIPTNSRTEEISIPFAFDIPISPSLPPSFKLHHDDIGGSVTYTVHLVGIKSPPCSGTESTSMAWNRINIGRSNIQITRPITFVPLDLSLSSSSSSSSLPSPPWSPQSTSPLPLPLFPSAPPSESSSLYSYSTTSTLIPRPPKIYKTSLSLRPPYAFFSPPATIHASVRPPLPPPIHTHPNSPFDIEQVILPSLPSLPLNHPLSILITLQSISPPLPPSSASHPEKFKFPKLPNSVDGFDLRLACCVGLSTNSANSAAGGGGGRERMVGWEIVAGREGDEQAKDRSDACGGLGDWKKNATLEISQPTWIPSSPPSPSSPSSPSSASSLPSPSSLSSSPTFHAPSSPPSPPEGQGQGLGHFTQKLTLSTTLTLPSTLPPSFTTRLLSTNYYIQLRVPFAGLNNNLLLNVGPLDVSSGIYPTSSMGATGAMGMGMGMGMMAMGAGAMGARGGAFGFGDDNLAGRGVRELPPYVYVLLLLFEFERTEES
ncbi:hypothetical protein SISNIDRAFT_489887 [Sistotremastrum niveocremeum HHB9708]|uniref:Arrestin-like N-terminal domain-containing protein n=1 Tax=Sistotremastrum niveocremeum HHB9708 TaxID=1314777 RepID=A0A164PEB4_9AGAM|nr:hypothetical protein SISNIDRAFT_489887 [Sistotremastrum niveocremeum HHB9708]